MSAAKPNVTANILSAKTPQTPGERSILIVGQKTSSGSATSGELKEGLLNIADFNTYFGRTSHLAMGGRSLINALSISRKRPTISAIGLSDNGSGVAATGKVIFAGTATEAGSILVEINSGKNNAYTLTVASGDTASTLGTALAAAIAADADSVVTGSNSSGVVSLTAVNKGTVGNSIGLRVSGTVAGLTYTINEMANGATDPSLTTLFDAIASKRYTSIVYPGEWTLSTLYDLLEARVNVDNKIRDGQGFISKRDTYANHNSALDALNKKTLNYQPNKLSSKTYTVNLATVSSITQTSGTATVTTATNHGLNSGMNVTFSGADQSEYNLTAATITVTGATTFTYAVDSGATSPATGTIVGVVNYKTAYCGGIHENPLCIAAQMAAYDDLRLTVGSNTSSIVTNGKGTGGSFFGGIPYHNTPFINLPIIQDDFEDDEADELEDSGGWLLRNNPANTVIISGAARTTYKTDTLGNPDVTFKFNEYVRTLSLVREYVFNNLKADFSQVILTDGDLIAGMPMVNREKFTGQMMSYYNNLSGSTGNKDYVLLRAGADNAKAFKQAITDTIVLTLSTGTITTESIANIVTQLRDIIVNFTPTFE